MTAVSLRSAFMLTESLGQRTRKARQPLGLNVIDAELMQ